MRQQPVSCLLLVALVLLVSVGLGALIVSLLPPIVRTELPSDLTSTPVVVVHDPTPRVVAPLSPTATVALSPEAILTTPTSTRVPTATSTPEPTVTNEPTVTTVTTVTPVRTMQQKG